MSDQSTDVITHPVECGNCGRDTYKFEKYCHRCGEARW